MSGYVFVEYPKCLYQGDGETLVVNDREEEDSAASMGWMTAKQFNDPNRVPQKVEEETVVEPAEVLPDSEEDSEVESDEENETVG